MAAEMNPMPCGLARLFTDASLVPDLLAAAEADAPRLLGSARANLDHVESDDEPAGDIYEHMARDAEQFVRRISLVAGEQLTEAGDAIARIARIPRGLRKPNHARTLEQALAQQIQAHYRGHRQIALAPLLQDAATRLSRVPGEWGDYCPGLLLGELRHLLAVAHVDGRRAVQLARDLAELRSRAAEESGIPAPDPKLTRIQNVVAYANAVNARHLRAIEDLYDRGGPAISVTEARATGILLSGAGLLVHLYTLGPVHCLGAPGIEAPPPQSPDDPVSVALSDGSIWDMSGLNAGLVALLMMYLTNDEFTADSGLVFPSLEIDIKSRKAAENRLDIGARKIAEHRKINKGLAMELLTSLMLARLDTAREVRCNCEARNGLPHKFAPAGVTDVEAFYDKPPPGFLVIAAVSSKSEVTPDFYRTQLDQAIEHAEALAATTDVPVYAVVLNGGDLVDDDDLDKTFRSFKESAVSGHRGRVRVLPMYAPALACAVRDLEVALEPDAFRFEADVLRRVFDALIDGLHDAGKRAQPDWMRDEWTQVVTGKPRKEEPSQRRGKKDSSPSP